jgi:uncharacterized protein (TIGR02466 family)
MLIDLFKIPIWKVYLKDIDLKSIESYCYSLQKKEKKGRNRSNVGGWQSTDLTGVHEPLNDLFNVILDNAEAFAKSIDIHTPLKFDNCWININGYKDYHLHHIHPKSVFSGVFYVNVPESKGFGGNIDFPHPSYLLMGGEWPKSIRTKENTYNSNSIWVKSIAGSLIIFPSWCMHGVEPNLSKKDKRIAISFNLLVQ